MTVATLMLPAVSTIYVHYENFSRLAQDRFSGSLAGKLFLRFGIDSEGLAAIVGASIAGACSLCADPDPERLRKALRAGVCDFVVGPLDEALRILKNELRRGRAVSVGMTAELDAALAEMMQRGLQPDFVSRAPGQPFQTFVDRGVPALGATDRSFPETAVVQWALSSDDARSMPQIIRVASQILDAARSDTPLRQHWLEQAPRHLGRPFAAQHCLRMTAAESAAFAAAARAQCPTIDITSGGTAL
jgi:Urocanase Rossmann-like domain